MTNAQQFADACYDQNSIEDLIDGLTGRAADKTDCEEWGITPTEWREALASALREKIADLETTIEDCKNG